MTLTYASVIGRESRVGHRDSAGAESTKSAVSSCSSEHAGIREVLFLIAIEELPVAVCRRQALTGVLVAAGRRDPHA